jgi:hypothetical protein
MKEKAKFGRRDTVRWITHERKYVGTVVLVKYHETTATYAYKVRNLGPHSYYWLEDADLELVCKAQPVTPEQALTANLHLYRTKMRRAQDLRTQADHTQDVALRLLNKTMQDLGYVKHARLTNGQDEAIIISDKVSDLYAYMGVGIVAVYCEAPGRPLPGSTYIHLAEEHEQTDGTTTFEFQKWRVLPKT